MADRYTQLLGLLGDKMNSPLLSTNNNLGGEAVGFGWKSFLYNIGLLSFFIFLILLFIHFTYRPIFSFSVDDEGLIPLTRRTDVQIAWKEPPAADNKASFENPLPVGFTVALDVFVDNSFSFSETKRVILYRGRTAIVPPNESRRDYRVIYPGSNFLMFFEEDTNDLVIMVFTRDARNNIQYESAPTLFNVPLKQFFRVVFVLFPNYLELYMNGKLVSTKQLKNQPLFSTNSFFSTPDLFRPGIVVQNLQYWPRTLSSLEIAKLGMSLPPNPKSDNPICGQ
jgi:hypothetical protein